jgi:hypothetical protein
MILQHTRALGRATAVSAALALLAVVLPVAATTAVSPTTCVVRNVDAGSVHRSLQRAIWRARPGARLVVKGTCIGTAIVSKPLSISGARAGSSEGGRSRLLSKGARPAIVIDPAVDALEIAPNVTVSGGIVIGQVARWKAGAKLDQEDVSLWTGSDGIDHELPRVRSWTFRRACDVRSDGTSLAAAAASAADGSHLVFYGVCPGPVDIGTELEIFGSRWTASSLRPDQSGRGIIDRSDSGRPAIGRLGMDPAIVVDPGVDELTLGGFRVHDGFRIGASTP